jgi:hypothetical protein
MKASSKHHAPSAVSPDKMTTIRDWVVVLKWDQFLAGKQTLVIHYVASHQNDSDIQHGNVIYRPVSDNQS